MWSRRDLELFGDDMVVGEGCGQGGWKNRTFAKLTQFPQKHPRQTIFAF